MRTLAISFVLLTVAVGAQNSQDGSSRLYRISGIVVNASTGRILPKVRVSIGPAEGDSHLTIVTGDDGRFSFEKLKLGKYWLQAQGRGFSPQRFDQHEEFSTAIAVGPAVDSEHLVFRVRPDATINGTIADELNEPVPQATVL